MIKLLFESITPVHISNGVELAYGLEYSLESNVFSKYNIPGIAQKLANKKVFDFKKNYTVDELEKIINDNFIEYESSDFEYIAGITKKFKELVYNPRAKGQKYVKEFINQNGSFYIPGSSVKGALLTVLNTKSLGIIAGENADIKDKFVIRDSNAISPKNFYVRTTNNRPPSINLMCMEPNVNFEISVMKKGRFDLKKFKEMLKAYSLRQIELALTNLKPFKGSVDREKGADLFEKSLVKIQNINLENEEYLINLGYGGGSWFKIEKDLKPMFYSKSRARKGQKEPAHTSFSFFFKEEYNHIGWCKLKIEE